MTTPLDSFGIRRAAHLGGRLRAYLDLPALATHFPEVTRLPVSLLILLENLLRHEDGELVTAAHLEQVARRGRHTGEPVEIAYHPSRVVMQDYSGLVALTDLATLRDRVAQAGGDGAAVRPVRPVDLVVDHSLVVDVARTPDALDRNLDNEYRQNKERYEFLKWAQAEFDGVRVVPPGNGIIHQINLEHLANVVCEDPSGLVHPETQIGTDSHTPMINGLGVLAWGVGGIEAEAAMLGEPVSMLVPDVVGVRLTGALPAGVLAMDLVLTLTQRLREVGVVGRFVEFFGPALANLTVADRATLANMAPEYGATCGMFPVDHKVIEHLGVTGRDPARTRLVEDYARAVGLWDDPASVRDYAEIVEIDLGTVGRSVAGPKRPQQRLELPQVAASTPAPRIGDPYGAHGDIPATLDHGDIVIAAITSCTTTSNPHAMVTAGLLARNAVAHGLTVDPRIKTSLAPGSRSVTRYLAEAGLTEALETLGFAVVGYGCATCVGNSGALDQAVEAEIRDRDLDVAAVLSGNRNFEGRIHPVVRSNYLASPPLVIAYALAGTMRADLDRDPLGTGADGTPVYLADLWPDPAETEAITARSAGPDAYAGVDIHAGGRRWDILSSPVGTHFPWDRNSTYISPSPFVEPAVPTDGPITAAVPLLVLGDNVTTDHISPVGSIESDGPAARLLTERGIARADFNSYGARRGNADVMVRGTFSNVRLRNDLVAPLTGGLTRLTGVGEPLAVHEAADLLRRVGVPAVVVAGAGYGAGSARDWAAKGTRMLGVRAVLARSFERIHRANLVLMGVVPVELPEDPGPLDADTRITVDLPTGPVPVQAHVEVHFDHPRYGRHTAAALVRVDTAQESAYLAQGGVLRAVLNKLIQRHTPHTQEAVA
ncbi:aconitate hydratase AcnA [Streptomyces iranensis]|uniref:Aconitate hydratase n=1 Tax=Streptomyces iranensis TaxID=576784 RepID=A0A060ZZB5_9ACTN|nr:aconitate hydratase AcnA [Streptomyces iranensis]MBP2066150.1 aconitate hydratase [Streptomyces iranensis]CDR13204.1 aconitate hydratase [Streptomyces iranensis]